MDYDLILIRYGELSLKSSYVRKQFESTLIRNIKNAFECSNIYGKIKTERGRIYLYTDEIARGLGVLKKVFGITSFSPAIKTTSDTADMITLALNFCQKTLNKEKSFALRITRTGEHDFSSQDVAVKLGNVIVDLALVNTPQSLLAAWYLMRRGCDILFLKTNNQIVDTLHSFITNWYAESDIIECDPKEKNLYETVNKITYERSCDAFVTGHTIYDTSQDILSDIKQFKKHINLPILHPLISMDFDEIDKKCMELGILE